MWIGEGDSTVCCYECQLVCGEVQVLGTIAVAAAFVATSGNEIVKQQSVYG